MKLKKRLLERSRLYIIIDSKALGQRSIVNTAGIIKDLGADIIQFRDKESKKEFILENARALRKILLNSQTIFIVNDYLDIAKIIDSDGLHLGQSDLSIGIARKILGKDKIIGISCHNLRQALLAQDRGADYIGIGPIFHSPTKSQNTKTTGLDLIKEIKRKIKIPYFAIGGINQNNIEEVVAAGSKRVAICSAICQAKNLVNTIENLRKQLKNDPIRIR